jgi:hypothetical protein
MKLKMFFIKKNNKLPFWNFVFYDFHEDVKIYRKTLTF